MRILQLSDLHYGKRYKTKIERILDPFIENLKEINEDKKIDFILFTGDLVFSGSNIDTFHEVKDNFIDIILESIDLDIENFILCAGNHDMSGKDEIPAITSYIDKINTGSELDNFIKDNDQQFDLSFEKSKNYISFVKEIYCNDNIDKLFQSFERVYRNKKIAFISFNTGWRSIKGKSSSNSLLLPRKTIVDSLKSVKKSDIYISLMHHPIKDLKQFNSYEVEDILYEKFHMNFSGHYHKKCQGVVCSHDIGMLAVSSMASMSGNDGSTIGFSVYDIDVDTYEIDISNFIYIDVDNVFTKTSSSTLKLPMNDTKNQQVHLVKSIRGRHEDVLGEANNLLIDFDQSERISFIDQFETPVLKSKSYYESVSNDKNSKIIPIDDLLNGNKCIFGKDKFGKTAILKSLELHYLNEYIELQVIPLYFNLKGFGRDKKVDLIDEIKKMLRVTKKNSEKIKRNSKFSFLIDNYDINSLIHQEFLKNLIDGVAKFQIIITAEENHESYSRDFSLDEINFCKIYIHPVTRKNIRSHTSKLLANYEADEQQNIIEKVITLFSQMNIPFNYWYISLFLWIYKKESNISISDNVEMLILYIDKILEREQIAKYNKNIDYELFKKLLGEFSHELLSKYYNENYSISYAELVDFLHSYKERNIRFIIDEESIIEYLLDKGIIKKIKSSGRYTFRLNGVMEYFTAIYMTDNSKFVDVILENNDFYLNFSNEIEIFSGLKKNNLDFLKKIHNKTELVVREINEKYQGNPDLLVNKEISESKKLAESIAGINIMKHLPINYEQQDAINDNLNPVQDFNEDVVVKKPIEFEDKPTIGQVERYAFILARSFRSLSAIEDIDQMNKTFDLIVKSYISIGLDFLEYVKLEENNLEIDEIEKKILKLMTHFTPLLTQVMLNEAILQQNLSIFIMKKIDTLEKDPFNNQYLLFLLYCMMLDMDLENNYNLIDNLIGDIDILSLKNVIIFKLIYYIGFKSCKNGALENFLKKKIIELQSSINPKSDKSKLAQRLNKQLLINKK